MEIYLVGGAVRDELLGRPVKERDWVIVGATPEELIALKFQPVGKDFPVFLHPKTHEEYALARTERKTSKGYKGFQFYATPDVSLKEDLKRRDLTINAIAKSESGELIDPYNGQADLKAHWLRHVSPAFSEDPVRILRIARFASMLPDFNVHAETNALMKNMVKAGEVDALVAERVWKELSRALMMPAPERFFDVLRACNALSVLFPALVDESAGITALKNAAKSNASEVVRFAVLLYPQTEKKIKQFCKHYRIPREHADLAILIANYLNDFQTLDITDADALLKLLRATDALRRTDRFNDFLTACEIIAGKNNQKIDRLQTALAAAKNIDTSKIIDKKLKGPEIAEAIYQLQKEAILQSNK